MASTFAVAASTFPAGVGVRVASRNVKSGVVGERERVGGFR